MSQINFRRSGHSSGLGNNQDPPSRFRVRTGLFVTTLGFVVFIIGAKPEWFNLDRSPVVGFVQIAVFLIGLALLCVGGYLGLVVLWAGGQRSILADIGLRLVTTGYVVAVFAGMADVFGMGSHPLPSVPYFGPWQAGGVVIGQSVIALGFLMLIPYKRKQKPG
ncbi:MAG: hypothetical protein JXA13_15400 [Anaerolineales bacterium]|nr:hypothetical protein [Anaerolineales bacterium]